MRKKIQTAVLTGALLAAFATPIMADETIYGVGASFNGDATLLRGTIDIEDDIRFEPFLGFSRVDPDRGNTATHYTIGTAIEYTKELHTNINGYVGGFAAIDRIDVGNSSTNFLFGPVAGVEYALDAHFTVGGEVRFDIGVGDDTILSTDSSILLRYYF